MPSIAAVATALPPVSISQAEARALIDTHYGSLLKPRSREVLGQVLSHPSIERRYFAFEHTLDLLGLKGEEVDARMERFRTFSVRL